MAPIVFSSALHHIENYGDVLDLASQSVAPGGAIVTLFDPVPAGVMGQCLRRLDWIVYAVLHEPLFVLRALRAKLRQERRAGEPAIGRLAERYAREGIDDRQLVAFLEARGFELILHERQFGARLAAVRAALRIVNAPSTFHLIARRPDQG